jgi:hypothetical protein
LQALARLVGWSTTLEALAMLALWEEGCAGRGRCEVSAASQEQLLW